MNDENFSVEELILDEFFNQWVISPVGSAEAYWKTWLEQHPDKRETVEEARQLIILLQQAFVEKNTLPESKTKHIWEQIQNKLIEKKTISEIS